MSSNKVVLVLDRVEAEHVLAATSHLSSPAGKAASKLRAALQQEGQEAAVEYRAVWDEGSTEAFLSRKVAEAHALEVGRSYVGDPETVRIQSRQTFTTDWIDLDEEEGKP